MATPIEPTPVLTGKDAERFLQRIEENHVVSLEEYERMKKAYERGMRIIDLE